MDGYLFRATNRFAVRTGWLHPPAAAFAKYGIVLFALALLAGWWLGRQRPETITLAAVVCAVVAVFVALGAAQLIGHAVGRARPYQVMTGTQLLVARTTDFSFPSDHATVAGAVAGGLWFVDRRLARVTTGLAVVMAVARVYVGAHYPGDVLAALLLGAAVAAAVHLLASRLLATLLCHLVRSPLRPLIGSVGDLERA